MKPIVPLLLIFGLLLSGCGTMETQPAAANPTATQIGNDGEPSPIQISAVPAAFTVSKQSADQAYGYSQEKPIKVGGQDSGPQRERMFLDQLAGPNGESIRYQRRGSCCPFSTPNGFMGTGMLDIYEVWVGSETSPRILYINMYDFEPPEVPVGFTSKSY